MFSDAKLQDVNIFHSRPSQADLCQRCIVLATILAGKLMVIEDYSEFLICKLSKPFCMLIF